MDFSEMKEMMKSDGVKEQAKTLVPGVFNGISSAIPSVIDDSFDPVSMFSRNSNKKSPTREDFLKDTKDVAAEIKRRNAESHMLTEEESAELLKEVRKSKTPSTKPKKSAKPDNQKKSSSKGFPSNLKELNEEEKKRFNSGKGYVSNIKFSVSTNEGKLVASTLERISTNFITLAKINTAGFRGTVSQLTYHENLIIEGAASRSYTYNQILKSINNTILANSKQSMFSLGTNVGIDDFIRSNLSTTFYLNKLVDLYKNDVGVLGSIKKAFSHPFQTLLQKGVKDGVKFIDKKNILGKANDLVNSIPSILLSGSEDGQFNKLKDKMKILYKVPLYGKLFKDFDIDGYVKNNIFGGKSLNDMMNPDIGANTLDKSTTVAFDAQTHNTINVVIPGYLSEIYTALSGESLYHDYRSGKWTNEEGMRNLLQDRIGKRLLNRNSKISYKLKELNPKDDATNSKLLYDLVNLGLDTPDKLDELKTLHPKHSELIDKLKTELDPKVLDSEVKLGKMIYRQENESSLKGTSGSNIFTRRDSSSSAPNQQQIGIEAPPSTAEQSLDTVRLASISSSSLRILELLRTNRFRGRSLGGGDNPPPDDGPSLDTGAEQPKPPSSPSPSSPSSSSSSPSSNNETLLDYLNKETPTSPSSPSSSSLLDYLNKENPTSPSSPSSSSSSHSSLLDYLNKETPTSAAESTSSVDIDGISVTESTDKSSSVSSIITDGIKEKIEEPINKYEDTLDKVDEITDVVEKVNPETAEKIRGITGKIRPSALKDKFMSSKLFSKLKNSRLGSKVGGKLESVATLSGKVSNIFKEGESATGLVTKVLGSSSKAGFILDKGTGLLNTGSKLLGGKLASKLAGKGISKLLGIATGPVGWAITAATMLPNIIKIAKNPKAAIKHPLKTAAALLGLGEVPTDEEKEANKQNQDEKNGSGLGSLLGTLGLGVLASPAILVNLLSKSLARYLGVGVGVLKKILGVSYKIGKGILKTGYKIGKWYLKTGFGLLKGILGFSYKTGKVIADKDLALTKGILGFSSKIGKGIAKKGLGLLKGASSKIGQSIAERFSLPNMLSTLDPKTADQFITTSKQYVRSEENLAQSVFSNTAVGSLYDLASGKTKAGGVLGRKFTQLFSAFGNNGNATSDVSITVNKGSSSTGATNSSGSSTSSSSSGGNQTTSGSSSTGSPASSGSSSVTSSTSQPSSVPNISGTVTNTDSSLNRVPDLNKNPIQIPSMGNNSSSVSLPADLNQISKDLENLISNNAGSNSVTLPNGTIVFKPSDDKYNSIVVQRPTININNTTNNYYGKSSAENPFFNKDEENKRILVLKDILKLVNSLGTDILTTGNKFTEILDRVVKTTDKQNTSNDLATKRVNILTSLVAVTNTIY